jgi:uroporphyrinogen decarboxylase
VAALYGLVKSYGKRVYPLCERSTSCSECDQRGTFNPFQPEVMDVEQMKRRYGNRLTFFGGISTQKTLPYGTVAEVKEEVRRLLDRVGRRGGYIAAPAHDVPKDARPENVAAMIEVLKAQ